MMPRHHPPEDMLFALAAGRLPAGQAIVVGAHAENCPRCAARLAEFESVGGVWLEAGEPEALAPGALSRVLERIAEPPRPQPQPDLPASMPELPPGMRWPASLAGRKLPRWMWGGPGKRFARVPVPEDTRGTVYLLWIEPGRGLAAHTHEGTELTYVLGGSFDDGRDVFAAGDLDVADASVKHRPVARPDGTCICMAYVRGDLKCDSTIAGWFGGLISV